MRSSTGLVGTVIASDFTLTEVPMLQPGANAVRIHNLGEQLHEMNLVELAPGETIEDASRGTARQQDRPPMASLGGATVKAGQKAVTVLELKRGGTYAFVCVIPDVLGDFVPHLFKGCSPHSPECHYARR